MTVIEVSASSIQITMFGALGLLRYFGHSEHGTIN